MPLPDPLEPRAVAALEEARQLEVLRIASSEQAPFADGQMFYAAPGSWANIASGVGLTQTPSRTEIDTFIEFYSSRRAEPRIELHSFAPAEFINALAERGFTLRGFESVLAFSVRGMPDDRDPPTIAGPDRFEIARVDPADDARLRAACAVSTRGFIPAEVTITDDLLEPALAVARHPGSAVFVAELASRPASIVASGIICRHGRAATLAGVSTEPEFRRRGIQRALIDARLRFARDAGCDLVTIGSRPGMPTERNALRAGFTPSYTKVALALAGPGLQPIAYS